MSEYTPITGELREYATVAWEPWPEARDRLYQMCDAIDSIHAQLERENAALKAELDRVLGEQDNGGTMPLPLDMNGKPVHIDDVMEWPTTGETFEVVGIGDGVLFYVEDGNEKADWTGASTKRHHASDTWERIIKEVLQRGHDDYPLNVDIEPYVARCKALCERTKEEA